MAKKKYYHANKEKYKEYQKKWWDKKTDEEKKEYRHKRYLKNKKMFNEASKKYIKEHRKRVTFLVNRRRKEIAESLKQKGQRYTYLPKKERENKMVESLSNYKNITLEEARELLVANDWNIKKLEFEHKVEKLREKYKEVL